MRKLFLVVCISFLSLPGRSINVKIQLFNEQRISAVSLICHGSYQLYTGHDSKAYVIEEGENNSFEINRCEKGIRIIAGEKIIGEFISAEFVPKNSECTFTLSDFDTKKSTLLLEDGVQLKAENNFLRIINLVNLEHYVADVMVCEVGKNKQVEFLKAKAIICRTYAMGSKLRHLPDSDLLCTNVHCQVYKGKQGVTPQILEAVRSTENQFISAKNNQFIIAAFHSNCGGRTQNSEDAWSSALPYLRAVEDTYCLHQPHATWELKIPLSSWNKYMDKIPDEPLSISVKAESGNVASGARQKYDVYKNKKILTQKLRNDWNLKSTWFTISEKNDSLLFSGRGYGHGVGLCQEGAMNMSERGYSCERIIKFYYKDVNIIKLSPAEMTNILHGN